MNNTKPGQATEAANRWRAENQAACDKRFPSGDAGSGRLLSGSELCKELLDDKIFAPQTWRAQQIQGAGYDLRLSGDNMIYPMESEVFVRVQAEKGDSVRSRIRLEPGESAVVATEERFTLASDISVSLGPKWHPAASGLLALQGTAARPGFGSQDWGYREGGEPLYVVVANIGPSTITLPVGEPIMYAQFFQVAQHSRMGDEVLRNGFVDIYTNLFEHQDGRGGLLFFRQARDLEKKVSQLESSRDLELARVTSDLEVVRQGVASAKSTAENVVLFGVFLVTVTILGVVLTSLATVAKDLDDAGNLEKAILAVVSSFFVAATVWVATRFVQSTKGTEKTSRRSPKAVSASLGDGTHT